jgi:hypothetical protein
MKLSDKLKRQRYEISMRIIELESKAGSRKLSRNEEQELKILKTKEIGLDERISNK